MVNLKLTAGDLVPETLGRDRSDLIEETLVGAAIVSVCVGIYIFGCARCNFSFPSPWASSLSNSLQSIRMYCCPIVVLLDHKIEWFRKRGVMPDVQVIYGDLNLRIMPLVGHANYLLYACSCVCTWRKGAAR
jgi:hypothetical protein